MVLADGVEVEVVHGAALVILPSLLFNPKKYMVLGNSIAGLSDVNNVPHGKVGSLCRPFFN